MSAPEIAHRVVEQSRKASFRKERRGWAAVDGAHAPLAAVPAFAARLGAIPLSCLAAFAPDRALGRVWPARLFENGQPTAELWRFDPVSGRQWPGAETAGFDVNVRSTSDQPDARSPYGDVKFVWEPARLQALHAFCVRAMQGDAGAATAAQAWLEGFMADNPPWRGVHWTSGIEIALRIVSAFFLVNARTAGPSDPAQQGELQRFVSAHAAWLARFPSLHSSANNHRVAEGLGLFLAGVLQRDTKTGRRHEAEGRSIIEHEALLQILPDGVGAEQSPTYQAFTMEMIGLACLVGRDMGEPFGREVEQRLQAGARFLRALENEQGVAPSIGDDDEGRVVACAGEHEPLYTASVASCIEALTGARAGGRQPGYLREHLFGVRAALEAPAGAAEDEVIEFSEGGYVCVRRPFGDHRLHLVFDRGPLGYLSLAAHGHADALAIWLSLDGKPVFIDAGTYLYHSGRQTRGELRRSQSHNTLSLDGLSQSEPSAAFSWRNRANARALESCRQNDLVTISGEHDGYLKRRNVRHQRRLILDRNALVIEDRLEGGTFKGQAGFLLAPDISARIKGRSFVLSRGSSLQLIMEVSGDASLASERASWSPSFGCLESTSRLIVSGVFGPQAISMRLSPGDSEA